MKWAWLGLLCWVGCLPPVWAAEEAAEEPLGVYYAVDLLPALESLYQTQSRNPPTMSLVTDKGVSVFFDKFADVKRENGVTTLTPIIDAKRKPELHALFSDLSKGKFSKRLFFRGKSEVFVDGSEIQVSFATRGQFNTPTSLNENDQNSWRELLVSQGRKIQYSPRLEKFKTYNGYTVYFGILTNDNKALSTKAVDEAMSERILDLFRGRAPEGLGINENYDLTYTEPGTENTIVLKLSFYYEEKGPDSGKHFTALENYNIQTMLIRHALYVLKVRPERNKTLVPPPITKLVPEKKTVTVAPVLVKPATQETALAYLEKLRGWADLMTFLEATSPALKQRLHTEASQRTIQFDPIDTHSEPELKSSRPDMLLVKELVLVANGHIRIANNFFANYQDFEKTSVLVYALLRGMSGIEKEEAFDFVTKVIIKLLLQKEQERQRVKVPENQRVDTLTNAQLEGFIFRMLDSAEITRDDYWLREALLEQKNTTKQPGSMAGPAADLFVAGNEERIRALRELRRKDVIAAFEKVFGSVPESVPADRTDR